MKKGLLAALCASTLLLGFGESSNLIEEAKNSVKSDLENPDSAQFRNIKVHKIQELMKIHEIQELMKVHEKNELMDDEYICGEVNEKNNMGEYTGYKRFVYLDNDIEIEQNNPNNKDGFKILFAMLCDGLSITEIKKKENQLDDIKDKLNKIKKEKHTNVENYKKGQITQYEFMKKEYELDMKRLKNIKNLLEIIKWFDELEKNYQLKLFSHFKLT